MKYSFKIPEKYRKYLPSKEFTKMIGVWALVFCVLFLIFFIFSKKESFNSKKGVDGLEVENQTIIGLINTDTDGDGLLDWEEALWGTDKNKKVTFNGIPDNIYVKNKKKELDIEQEKNDLTLTETERFAREFFSAYTALKASGEVDNQSINAFSDALGQRIANPTLIDKYKDTETNINTEDTEFNRVEYYRELKNLFQKYEKEGLGDELDIVNSDLSIYSSTSTNTGQNQELIKIAQAYQDFGKSVMKVSVPIGLLDIHLAIANGANNTGISVLNMTKIITDPLVGLSGLSQYEKYSNDLITAVEELEGSLQE